MRCQHFRLSMPEATERYWFEVLYPGALTAPDPDAVRRRFHEAANQPIASIIDIGEDRSWLVGGTLIYFRDGLPYASYMPDGVRIELLSLDSTPVSPRRDLATEVLRGRWTWERDARGASFSTFAKHTRDLAEGVMGELLDLHSMAEYSRRDREDWRGKQFTRKTLRPVFAAFEAALRDFRKRLDPEALKTCYAVHNLRIDTVRWLMEGKTARSVRYRCQAMRAEPALVGAAITAKTMAGARALAGLARAVGGGHSVVEALCQFQIQGDPDVWRPAVKFLCGRSLRNTLLVTDAAWHTQEDYSVLATADFVRRLSGNQRPTNREQWRTLAQVAYIHGLATESRSTGIAPASFIKGHSMRDLSTFVVADDYLQVRDTISAAVGTVRGEEQRIFADIAKLRGTTAHHVQRVLEPNLNAPPERALGRLTLAQLLTLSRYYHGEVREQVEHDVDILDLARGAQGDAGGPSTETRWPASMLAAPAGDIECVELRSPQDLVEEGRLMHHCVGSACYLRACALGASRIFSLRAGGKRAATLEVTWREGVPTIAQLYGPYDAKPSGACRAASEELLRPGHLGDRPRSDEDLMRMLEASDAARSGRGGDFWLRADLVCYDLRCRIERMQGGAVPWNRPARAKAA